MEVSRTENPFNFSYRLMRFYYEQKILKGYNPEWVQEVMYAYLRSKNVMK